MPRLHRIPAVNTVHVAPINDIDDAYSWPREHARLDAFRTRLHHMNVNLKSMSMATLFSGVYAPAVARTSVSLTLDTLVGCGATDVGDAPQYAYLGACDADSHCRMELQCLPHPPQHLFSDIDSVLTPRRRRDSCSWRVRHMDSTQMHHSEAFCNYTHRPLLDS